MNKPLSSFLERWAAASEWLAALACLGMFAGLFWSRAALSISIIVFFANALHPHFLRRRLKLLGHDRFALACILFFLLYVLSGLWSNDTKSYWDATVNKVPFAVLPFSFYSLGLKGRHKKVLIVALLGMQLLVIFYSLSQLFMNWDYYIHGYHFSHNLPTTKYNDHIRFSLSLVLSLLLIFYLLFDRWPFRKHSSAWKLFFVGVAVIFIIYLHVLAAKTGLLCLYVMFFCYALAKLWKRSKLIALASASFVCMLPIAAYFIVPTYKTKIDYIIYEVRIAKERAAFDYTLSDQGRLISYAVGMEVFKDHAFLGAGVGDVKAEMSNAYRYLYPDIPEENHLIPHNQFLYSLVATGILGFPLFLLMFAAGFMGSGRIHLYGTITGIIFLVAFLAEAMLEVQFGVFIFLFYTLYWKQSGR